MNDRPTARPRRWRAARALCLMATWLAAVAGDAVAYVVRVDDRRAVEALGGVVRDGDDEWTFEVSGRVGRSAVFKQNGRVVARLVAGAGEQPASVSVGVARWSAGAHVVAPLARADIDAATARAIRAAAVGLAELRPAAEDRELRLTVLQLYAEVARVQSELVAGGPVGQPLALPRGADLRHDEAACAGYTRDALFDCRDSDGTLVAVVPFLDEPRIEALHGGVGLRSHQPDQCYGACGAGCGGKCVEVPVACDAAAGDLAPGALCYHPLAEPNRRYLPADDFDTASTRCPAGASARGRVTVCTAAPCCFAHDECNRHDRLLNYLKCQLWGLRECGFSAVFGVPKTEWEIKWFHARDQGTPINLGSPPVSAGSCDAGNWTPPAVVPHEQEQAECPVHRRKHTHE